MNDSDGPWVKQYVGNLREERHKAEELHRLGLACGFVAPAVLGMDAEVDALQFERLRDITPLRALYLAHATGREPAGSVVPRFRAAGEALACLHGRLELESKRPWDPPRPFRRFFERRVRRQLDEVFGRTPQAFLHGDFGFGNVQVIGANAQIVVLDASPNGYLTFHPYTFGSVYLDLASFVACLRGLVGIGPFLRLHRDRIGALETAFVGGYEARAGIRLDRTMLDGAAYAVAGTYLLSRIQSSVVAAVLLRWMFPTLPRPGPAL